LARLTLVYPNERNAVEHKVSVFSPLGSAILGYPQGSEIELDGKQAITRFSIEKIIYQPEASGDYHL
jgi:regulator of nucleoside diphosphate kinase